MGIDASKISEVLPHAVQFPHTWLSQLTRRFFTRLHGFMSWVWLVLVAIVVINVTMRYLFGEGRIEFEEIQWHLFAAGFLIGLATCMDSDNHVRVDVFHDRLSLRHQAWIEVYGLLLLFLPFVVAMIIFSLPFVGYSYASAEVSDAPGGLPFRWIIKSFLPLSMVLLLLAGLGRLSRAMSFLFSWPRHVD